jgi:mycothiol synthase
VTVPSAPGARIAEGPLAPERAAQILALAAAAEAADGVDPLSEDVLLQVRHGSGPLARDVVLAADGQHLLGYAHLDEPDDEAQGGDMSGELVVHPAHRRQGHGATLLAGLLASAPGHGVRLWAHGDLPGAKALAGKTGFTRIRALLQLRMPLAKAPATEPAFPDGVTVRPFAPGADEAAWLAVNHRAFAHHPEQGSWTMDDLRLREEEPWFDPNGFFLAERDGRLAGFHWTKVHQPAGGRGAPIGEVYVVGVDPAEQGSGLGRALTLIGLRYLRDRGLPAVMLYVDESNPAAIRLYESLGFAHTGTDVMFTAARPTAGG